MNSYFGNPYSPTGLEGGGGLVLHRERFEQGQYVNIQIGEGRTAIGVVTSIHPVTGLVSVHTRHGYSVEVAPTAVRRAFLLVLDLNGVLGARGRGSFVCRPHVEAFLKFAFSNFAVAVWTSGLERSSKPIIESVFGGYKDRLLFCMFRDQCTSKPRLDNPYGTEKDLQMIFNRYPESFHSVNTIIIDDSPDKCSHPDIALCPVPFKDPVFQANDDGLAKAMTVLEEVLRLDSHTPLISAAEERLRELQLHPVTTPSDPHPPTVEGKEEGGEELHGVDIWRTRLCCEYLRGNCPNGDACQYSHEEDDGRPCYRKGGCKYHRDRWVWVDDPAKRRNRQKRDKKPAPQNLDDRYQWSGTAATGTSHTGIPHLDAVNEQQQGGGGGMSMGGFGTIFSTNPTMQQPQPQPQRQQRPSESSLHFHEQSRGGGIDVAALHAQMNGGGGAPPPQRGRGGGRSRGGRGGRQDGSEGSVHLTANNSDDGALLRQLLAFTKQ